MPNRSLAAIWLTLVAGCGFTTVPQQEACNFFVADGRLYALQSDASYGTEGPVYASDDGGQTWTKAKTPEATCALAASGGESFALTSKGEIWKRLAGDESWTLLKQGHSAAFASREYLYDVSVSKDGTVCVAACEELWLLDRSGQRTQRFGSPERSSSPLGREMFLRTCFA